MEEEALRHLLGTWQLVSLETLGADGTASHPYGSAPVGYLMYTAGRRMAASIMRSPAPRVQSPDLFAGAAEALVSGHTFVAYTGAVALENPQTTSPGSWHGTVIHTLDTCSYPNWVGTRQRRHFLLEAGALTLITPPIERAGSRATATVIWKRL